MIDRQQYHVSWLQEENSKQHPANSTKQLQKLVNASLRSRCIFIFICKIQTFLSALTGWHHTES